MTSYVDDVNKIRSLGFVSKDAEYINIQSAKVS